MDFIVVDFETYYDSEYSLRNMNPLEYILDPRFEATGAAILSNCGGEEVCEWVEGPDLPRAFKRIGEAKPWSRRVLMSHNIGFDGAILAWRYGIVPGLYVDTLGMARAFVYPHTGSASLDAVASFYRVGAKDGGALVNARGMRLADLKAAPDVYARYRQYAMEDARLCSRVFACMKASMPHDEYSVMDMVARMAILPQVTLDRDVLQQSLDKILQDKENLLSVVYDGLPRAIQVAFTGEDKPAAVKNALMSNDKLAMVLEWRGVSPPRKTSPATGKETWAFAKTDKDFVALQEHDDPLVQAIVAARLGVKSTIEETRTRKFLAVCDLRWPKKGMRAITERSALAGVPPRPMPMPMPLRYSGARTHRFSGEWGLNVMNMGRKSMLRKAVKAPPGWKLISADESQVEARLTAAVAGQGNLVTAFIRGDDVYSSFASMVFGRPINKNDHPKERFLGKTAILGLGYGMGAERYAATCWVQGRVEVSIDEARKVVHKYRETYSLIPRLWSLFSFALSDLFNKSSPHSSSFRMAAGVLVSFDVTENGTRNIIVLLPNGMPIPYLDIQRHSDRWADGSPRFSYSCKDGKGRRFINGTLMTENLIQALARIVVMEAAVRLRNRGFPWLPLVQIHDELVYCVPDSMAKSAAALIVDEMSATPTWLGIDGLIKAEAHIGDTLLDVK